MASAAFIDSNGRGIYRVLHDVEPPVRGSVVICPPLANEWANSQRVLVNLARRLAREGWSVCRHDYWATGESPGELEQCQFETFVDSTVSVIQSSAVPPIVLVAVRAAALFLPEVVRRVAGVAGVLWVDPVFSGRRYVKELRLAASVGDLQNATSPSRRDGAALDVGSFVFGAELLRRFESITATPADCGELPRLVVWTAPAGADAKLAAELGDLTVRSAKDLPRFWAKKDQFRSAELESCAATWIHSLSGGADA